MKHHFNLKVIQTFLSVPLLILTLAFSFQPLALSETFYSATLTITNLANTTNNTITVNANTRTWKETVSAPATEFATAGDIGAAATNLYRHLTSYPITPTTDQLIISQLTNGVRITSQIGGSLTATAAGDWANIVIYTNTRTPLRPLALPLSANPNADAATNAASQLVTALDYSTNSVDPNATAVATLANLITAQLLQNKTLTNAILYAVGGYLTNLTLDSCLLTNINARGAGDGSIQIGTNYPGYYSTNRATAIGHNIDATGVESAAYGYGSKARGLHSIALGANTHAFADNSVSVGYNSWATYAESTAIGYQATSSATNQIALGDPTADALCEIALNGYPTFLTPATNTLGWYGLFGSQTNGTWYGGTIAAATSISGVIGNTTNGYWYNANIKTLTSTNNTLNMTVLNDDTSYEQGGVNTLTAGVNALDATGYSFMEIYSAPASAFSLAEIKGGRPGKILHLINNSGQNMTLIDESGMATSATNRITTNLGGDWSTTGSGSAILIYNGHTQRWNFMSGSQ